MKVKRSTKWWYVRRKHLKTENTCQWCESAANLQVHHIVPFHIDQSKELDFTNLITLCESPNHNCHRRVGHLGAWIRFNPKVRQDCESRKKVRTQILNTQNNEKVVSI